MIIEAAGYKRKTICCTPMQTTQESELLDQLKKEENASFALLYKFYYPTVATYVSRNNGNHADAEDVFQETIIILLRQVRQPDFVLTSSLKTYLFAIARNSWLKRLRDTRRIVPTTVETYYELEQTTTLELNLEPNLDQQMTNWLTRITRNCQRILNAIFFYGEPMESLMQKMGWKNKHTAANQQYKCIQQVKREKNKDEQAW